MASSSSHGSSHGKSVVLDNETFVGLLASAMKDAASNEETEHSELLALEVSMGDNACALFDAMDGAVKSFFEKNVAGGVGINLTAASKVYMLDPWWNPAVEEQAVDRVHRIGQDRRVFVYRMITQGTIEERIQQLKKEKRELFESTLGHLGSAKDLAEHFGDLEELANLLPPE